MVTLNLLLSIVASSLKIAESMVSAMTPEQKAAFWERHDARMKFWEDLVARFKDKVE